MKILIDLGHPAHFHYFKNFSSIMKERGHEIFYSARDKEILQTLLNHHQVPFKSRGKGGKSFLGKLFYILKADYILYRLAKKHKPDIFLSFASTYAAHVARLYGKPHIALDDTEHAKLELLMYPPFTDVIINPSSFWKKFSDKQIFIQTFFELNYLGPKYFKPDSDILKLYQIDENEVFFILRFVSWNASHDFGAKGLSQSEKNNIVKKLSAAGRVFISSEDQLPIELLPFALKINPIHIHHILAKASLYLGEGATTASECVALGTPAIYINSLNAGTLQEQEEKYGLMSIRNASELDEVLDKFLKHMREEKQLRVKLRYKLLEDKLDGTAFLVWFMENYPQSPKILRENPEFQYQFKE